MCEDLIVYEKGCLYAYEITDSKIEIRKNVFNGTHSELVGIAKTREQAIRFIDRAERYIK